MIWDVISSVRVGENGYAFVTDETGKLVSHPDMSLVLRGSDLAAMPQVAAALAGRGEGAPVQVTGLDGEKVLSTHVRVPRLGWIVFVELPMREVLKPVVVSAMQTLALLALGVLVAVLLGAMLASRLVVPLKQLQAGAERLGEGDLGQRIAVTSRDEIGTLAVRFNDMAARIQDAQETLEAKVEARTVALRRSLEDLRAAQDRLVQTEKLASLGQLTAGIAHEIKNPLNFVNNFAELSAGLVDELRTAVDAAGEALPAARREEIGEVADLLKGNLGRILQHGKRADSIVRNMLLHSRGGAGEARAMDVNAVVEEAVNLAYHGARAERPGFNVTINRKFDSEAGEAVIYPQEFTRVLLNLVGNAFQATEKRAAEDPAVSPEVTVTTRARGDRVRVKVRDNGVGIPADIRARIFEPFFTTKPAGQGTGLGLSISHDIVAKQHGGKIEVFSEPGRFTEFVVTIPREPPRSTPPHDRADPRRRRRGRHRAPVPPAVPPGPPGRPLRHGLRLLRPRRHRLPRRRDGRADHPSPVRHQHAGHERARPARAREGRTPRPARHHDHGLWRRADARARRGGRSDRPRAQADRLRAPPAPDRPPPRRRSAGLIGPAKILVVDDEPDVEVLVQQRFRRAIRDGEVSFLFAEDGVSALDVLERDGPVDLVVTDINMPRMDGLTLLGRLQDREEKVCTVIVSAYGDMGNIRSAMNRGAFDFLIKPIDFADLEATLAKTMHHVREARQAKERVLAAERAQAALSRYFSPNLAAELAAAGGVEALAGGRRDLTVMFTTSRASPRWSRRSTPKSCRACSTSISAE